MRLMADGDQTGGAHRLGGGRGGGGNDKMREIEREAIKGKDKIQMFRG